jgi:hypothetical protein
MKVETLQQLSKLIALCRKQGVDKISVDGITVELGAPPLKAIKTKETLYQGALTENTKIETPDELTPEQLLMWSVGLTSDQIGS